MAQGTTENIDTLIAWCHHGPERARVDKVEVKDVEEKSSFRSLLKTSFASCFFKSASGKEAAFLRGGIIIHSAE